jgi:hypothetical protein
MDSGHYSAAACQAASRAGAYFSVTARMDPPVKVAIAGFGEDAWTPIPDPQAVWDDQLACWVSDADVAQTEYTAFTSKKGQQITARLIVRRVRDRNHNTREQGELFPVWRYHPVFTSSPFTLIQAGEQRRDHAEIEQVFADQISGPLAHLPSGKFTANAAWLTLTGIAHNLLRAAGCLASPRHARARGATTRADLIHVAARLARHGRGHLTLHLPLSWHREHEWLTLFQAGCGPCQPGRPDQPRPVTPRYTATRHQDQTQIEGTGHAAEPVSGKTATLA